MGKLLLFTRARRPETEHVDRQENAELIMFTGVRYERQESDEDKQADDKPQRESGG